MRTKSGCRTQIDRVGRCLILPILGYRLATKLSEITGNNGIDDVKQYFKKSDA
jgi:hypothetical protein